MFSPWISSLQLILIALFWRGIFTVSLTAGTVPLLDSNVPQTLSRSAVITGDSLVEKVEILTPIDLQLSCTCNANPNKLPNVTGFWRKDGIEIDNSRLTVLLEKEQYNLKREFSIDGDNLGNYSCVFYVGDKESRIDFYLTAPEMEGKQDKPVIAYVGDSVTMACKIKHLPNAWIWYKANGTQQELINATTDPLHYKMVVDGNATKLTLKNLKELDSGVYICSAVYNIKASVKQMEVRVISFMEPLKPFIAIVAEVILLVTLILFFERWGSKKSDDLPAENMIPVDQLDKLTQDDNNGMGESNARQRNV
ncbi:hypothetical protein DPEC_G00124230 [Dallia pectoralis]|uniref:Uncharacterized protein n=1 Tax=Dallia pectoralis TaxID=75939 RepID=A0ACC2GQS0_DALPE|nr:hypothetical protein DPEC_G00124230 [Dallia pectoralis]